MKAPEAYNQDHKEIYGDWCTLIAGACASAYNLDVAIDYDDIERVAGLGFKKYGGDHPTNHSTKLGARLYAEKYGAVAQVLPASDFAHMIPWYVYQISIYTSPELIKDSQDDGIVQKLLTRNPGDKGHSLVGWNDGTKVHIQDNFPGLLKRNHYIVDVEAFMPIVKYIVLIHYRHDNDKIVQFLRSHVGEKAITGLANIIPK